VAWRGRIRLTEECLFICIFVEGHRDSRQAVTVSARRYRKFSRCWQIQRIYPYAGLRTQDYARRGACSVRAVMDGPRMWKSQRRPELGLNKLETGGQSREQQWGHGDFGRQPSGARPEGSTRTGPGWTSQPTLDWAFQLWLHCNTRSMLTYKWRQHSRIVYSTFIHWYFCRFTKHSQNTDTSVHLKAKRNAFDTTECVLGTLTWKHTQAWD